MVFCVTNASKRNLIGKSAIFLLIGFFIVDRISLCLIIPYFGFFTIGTAIAIADAFQQQIIIKQQGIEYSGVGFSVELLWEKIADIDTDLLFREEGLYINKSQVLPKTQYFNLKPYKGMNFRKEFFLPLSRFQKNWRDNELGHQIKQYAPHLFVEHTQEKE